MCLLEFNGGNGVDIVSECRVLRSFGFSLLLYLGRVLDYDLYFVSDDAGVSNNMLVLMVECVL